MTATSPTSAWRDSLAALTAPARAAWRARVDQLTPPDGCSVEALEAIEHRAYCEIEPHGHPWREIVAGWPVDRRRRLARLALELAEAGTFEPSNERQAFLAIAAEDDPPGLEAFDPAAAAVEAL